MAHIHFDPKYAPCGFLIVRKDGDPYKEQDTALVQTDWNYPGVAQRMGWAPCHEETDGTVDCHCGNTAATLISQAYDFIRKYAEKEFLELDEYLTEGESRG